MFEVILAFKWLARLFASVWISVVAFVMFLHCAFAWVEKHQTSVFEKTASEAEPDKNG